MTAASKVTSAPPPLPPRTGSAQYLAPSSAPRKRLPRWAWGLIGVGIGLLIGVLILVVLPALTARSDVGPVAPAPADSTGAATTLPTTLPTTPPTDTSTAMPQSELTEPLSAQDALVALAQLGSSDGQPLTKYYRDNFGPSWSDVDRNGCDTRNDVLGRDLLNPVFKAGTGDCKVLSGMLIDPYDGGAIDFVSGQDTSPLVQIDHVVALSWAWKHGASTWTPDDRLMFANDPLNLLASGAAQNQAKSDYGPSKWLPPVRELQCPFVERWVSVLDKHALGIGDADRRVAREVLESC